MEGDLTAAGQKAVQGVRQVQEAEGAASDQIAKAQQGLSDLQGEQAEELRQRQQQTREVHAELDKQDAANLKTARDYTIPDFWKGHEGAQVGSIIAMAMGSIAQGILGGQNGAAMLVNKKVDDYFHRQKDKVDNLYRYAESQGKLNDATRHRYVQDLLNLQQQHTAVNQSVISHIKSVEAQNQGNINRASTDSLIAQLEQKNLKQIEDHRNLSFEQQMKVRGQEQAERAQREANSIARGNLALQRQELALKAAGGIGGHAPTGEMLKSQGFADTARANDQIISQTPISSKGMETILTDMQREAMFKEGGVGRSIAQTLGAWKTIEQKLSPQDQRALLAARQFINADLRRESGAAISPVEFQSAFARYFPMVGDSADTIRQKAANRQQSIHSMDVAGGMARGGNPVTVGQQTGGASAQGQPPIGTRATSGGKPIVMTANGWQLAQ
jgi:ribosomal protein S13